MKFKNFIAYIFGGGYLIYNKRYKANVEVDGGYYRGRSWKIVSCSGMYPLVYIEGDEDVYGREDGPAHGGITFRGQRFDLGMPHAIGYDYCHSDDYVMMQVKSDDPVVKGLLEGKMHSIRSIRKNIKKTINWLNRKEFENENSK